MIWQNRIVKGDLDCVSADEILDLLSLLNSEQGKTVTMVTQNPAAERLHLDEGVVSHSRMTAAKLLLGP